MHTCVAKNHNIHVWYEQDTYLPFKAKCNSPYNVDVWGYYVYCTMLMQGGYYVYGNKWLVMYIICSLSNGIWRPGSSLYANALLHRQRLLTLMRWKIQVLTSKWFQKHKNLSKSESHMNFKFSFTAKWSLTLAECYNTQLKVIQYVKVIFVEFGIWVTIQLYDVNQHGHR